MSNIEIYEDGKQISVAELLLPWVGVIILISFFLSLFVSALIFEKHNGEPTKESCIEYFENNTK